MTDLLSSQAFAAGFTEKVVSENVTGAKILTLADGVMKDWTLTGNTTVTMPGDPPTGFSTTVTIGAFQDGTGGRTLTFPSSVIWDGDVAPALTGTANRGDIICLTFMRGKWIASLQNKNVPGV